MVRDEAPARHEVAPFVIGLIAGAVMVTAGVLVGHAFGSGNEIAGVVGGLGCVVGLAVLITRRFL